MSIIWHDLECGSYSEDLAFWRELAERHGGPILDVGAGTGRVTVELARLGHSVVALDRDPELLGALELRTAGLAAETVVADARDFEIDARFATCIVPMQTIQLLGGSEGRSRFLHCASAHLLPGGVLAVALSAELDVFEIPQESPMPLADMTEVDGTVYSSQPVAVRAAEKQFVLVRRRERVSPDGSRSVVEDAIGLDRLTPEQLEREALSAGLSPVGRAEIRETREYVGSTVVMLGV